MRTLYLRIVITTLVVMIFSSLLAFIISNAYYQSNLKPHNDKRITGMAHDIVTFYEKNQNVNIDAYLESIGKLGYQIYLVNEDNKGSFYGGEYRKKDLDTKIINSVIAGQEYHGIANFPSSAFITGFFDNVLTNTVGVPLVINDEPYAMFLRSDVEVQFGELRFFFALLLVVTSLLSIIFVTVSTRYLVKPITKLTEATKQITKGKYDIELQVNRSDEIGVLASNFSEMVRSIEQLEEMRQEFVSNVSHEIQTPLASIKGFAQMLQEKDLLEEQQRHYLSIIEDESQRLSQLSKQLLTLASLDKEQGILEKTTFDVAAQIKQIVTVTQWSWREKELALDLDLPTTNLTGDQKLLYQVWTNLLTNSIKYSNPGDSISIRVWSEDDYCCIEIEDTGVGISEEDIPHIFTRFYKGDKSRSRQDVRNSSGLGLAIVKKIIDLHNGKIEVSSQQRIGTTFKVTLPNM
ncbi:sensor histidine kinase [Bacillus massiliigorillae]|uniref:sensor histidine kinase n=1 Tax=Bacillus massiliigorillae TaxID=1243664 RepID=UPI0005A86E9B|nr:HAMP domain-containing sensor histidine kinase [Bacillus massiliigorillae]